jgi:CheY-like chemotaxis protein
MMPEMDGYETMREIRKVPDFLSRTFFCARLTFSTSQRTIHVERT